MVEKKGHDGLITHNMKHFDVIACLAQQFSVFQSMGGKASMVGVSVVLWWQRN